MGHRKETTMSKPIALTPVQQLVLSKLVPEKIDKSLVLPGTHSGRLVLTVDYGLKVGKPFRKKVPNTVDVWGLIGLLMSKLNGATIDATVAEFLATDGKIDSKAIKEAAQSAIDTIKGTTKAPQYGSATGPVDVVAMIATVENEPEGPLPVPLPVEEEQTVQTAS
jgi:hypothetical protein